MVVSKKLSGKNDALLIGGDETKRHILKFEITTQTFEVMNMSLLLSQREDRSCIWHVTWNEPTDGRDSDFNKYETSEIINFDDNMITLGNPMNSKRAIKYFAVYCHIIVFIAFSENKNILSVSLFKATNQCPAKMASLHATMACYTFFESSWHAKFQSMWEWVTPLMAVMQLAGEHST